MNINDFLRIKRNYLNRCEKIVEGDLKDEEKINKADFNGVYIIIDENDEVVYIGSAYTSKFLIRDRLKIHLKGHPSNATVINYLVNNDKTIDREIAKKTLYDKYKFIAYKYESLEYKLMEDVTGLYNQKGNKK